MSRKYPALWLLAAVMSGLIIADLSTLPAWLWLVAALVTVLTGVARLATRLGVALVIGSLVLLSGFHHALRYQQGGVRHLARLVSQSENYRIHGHVADWPLIRDNRTDITIDVDSLISDRRYAVDGNLLLRVTSQTTALQRGDRVAFTARVYPLEERPTSQAMNYARYLRLHGISGISYLPTVLNVQIERRHPVSYIPLVDAVRAYIVESFDKDLSPTAAALAKGYLLGETRDISPEVYAMFRDSGTLHVLAVSGSNVALVLLVFHLLMRPLPWSRSKRHAVLLFVISVYAGLCYFEPSVMRASLMAALVIVARTARRKVDLNQIIALTASIVLLIDPAQFFDVGFQLSFVTAWGLIFIVPRITAIFAEHHARRWYRWLVFPLVVALVAQVVSTPLIAFYFEKVPVLSVPANLVIVPLVSLGVIGVVALPLVHLVWPILGRFAGSFLDPLLRLAIVVMEWFGGETLPVLTTSGYLEPPWSHLIAVATYFFIALATLAINSLKIRRALVFSTLGLALILTAAAAIRPSGPSTRIWIDRIPGGVAVLIHDHTGSGDLVVTSLVDRNYPIDERILLPMLQRRSIDRLRSITALDISYGAVDDLLRLAKRTHVTQLQVHRSLKAMFGDIIKGDSSYRYIQLLEFSGCITTTDTDAFAVGDDGVFVQQGDHRTLIVDVLNDNHFKHLLPTPTTLVIGRPWRPVPDDWVRLRRVGFERIVAGSIRTYQPDPDGNLETDSDEIAPYYVHDLMDLGPLELQFDPRLRRRQTPQPPQ